MWPLTSLLTATPPMINCCTPRHAHQSVAVKLKDTRCGVEEVSGCVAEVCMFVCCCLGDVHVSESMCIVAPALLTYPSTHLPTSPPPSISHISRTSAATLSQRTREKWKSEDKRNNYCNFGFSSPLLASPCFADLYLSSQELDILR